MRPPRSGEVYNRLNYLEGGKDCPKIAGQRLQAVLHGEGEHDQKAAGYD
jgi:hypothetical protein